MDNAAAADLVRGARDGGHVLRAVDAGGAQDAHALRDDGGLGVVVLVAAARGDQRDDQRDGYDGCE
jgi:hypothetical protein